MTDWFLFRGRGKSTFGGIGFGMFKMLQGSQWAGQLKLGKVMALNNSQIAKE